jgi:hypothetical protein
VGKWESRALCGISKRGGKVVFLTFPPRVFSTALCAGVIACARALPCALKRPSRCGPWVRLSVPSKCAPGPPRLTRAASGPHFRKRCTATARSGERCKSAPLRNKKLCALHTPGVAAKLGTKGGHRRTVYRPDNLETFDAPQDAKDLLQLLAATICEVRAGKVETKVASCISYLSTSFLNAFEIADLDVRLRALEARRDESKS